MMPRSEFESLALKFAALGVRMGVPAFFKLMPEMSHYYAMKNEYQFITEDRANIQVSTVQWDVKDGARFDIGFIDDSGQKTPCPVIIHASSFGSIERTLCALLENIAHDELQGRAPSFPYWLAPVQVRIIPVSDKYLEFAVACCSKIEVRNARVDVDDRDGTVGKKIRDAEKEWIPYTVVLDEKEMSTGRHSVRSRGEGQMGVSEDALLSMLAEKQDGMPFRPLPFGRKLSERPSFVG